MSCIVVCQTPAFLRHGIPKKGLRCAGFWYNTHTMAAWLCDDVGQLFVGRLTPAPRRGRAASPLCVGHFGCSGRTSAKAQELLRPVLRGCGRGLAPLPLWTWVEHGPGTQSGSSGSETSASASPLSAGSVAAVEALLRSSDEAAGSSGRLRGHTRLALPRRHSVVCVLCSWRYRWRMSSACKDVV